MPDRPRSLRAVTFTMAGCTLVGLAFWLPRSNWIFGGATVFTALLTFLVLWLFWRGHNWTRWLIMATTALLVLPNALVALLTLCHGDIGDPRPALFRVFLLAEGIFGLYLLVWLNTRSVRAYFLSA